MRSLKVIGIVFGVVLIASAAFSDSRFSVFGKVNFIAATGLESDYEVGVNEFPFVSAYQNLGIGFGLTFGKTLFAGIEGHYNLSGKVTLTGPPVDPDTVEVDTYRYASGLFIFGCNLVNNRRVRLYLNGGAGVRYNLEDEIKSYVSENGELTEVDPPDKRSILEGFGGAGLEVYLSRNSGVLLSGRYLYVALEEPQKAMVVIAGVVYRF
ncbi:MAG: hypothetical protein OEY25_11515 [Candidatus Aminicenantes bacterium]|nr:hypothetical protein [Candidatus Aminicenantes bacterium]